MTARWDDLPPKMRARSSTRPRRTAPAPRDVRYVCTGVGGCGETHDSYAKVESCANGHGGARIEIAANDTEGS